jgi:transcription initiation factor IIE alpha subunit
VTIDRNTVTIANNAQRTSRAVAEKVLPRTGTLRRQVYEYFYRRGLAGSTDEEAQAALNIDGNTMRPTRGSLVKDGYLIDTGTTRKNAKGHECIVWRTAEQDMLL